jgi:integrase
MPRPVSVPSYRLHKQSGQAVVTLSDGLGGRRDVLLGRYGTPESRAEYARVIAEWEAGGRRLPARGAEGSAAADLTVNELLLHYWRWAGQHYRDAGGNQSRELENVRLAVRPLKALYGHIPARDFGPLALRAVRQALVEQPVTARVKVTEPETGKARWEEKVLRHGLARRVVNARVNRIRRVFKWAVGMELLPPSVLQGLQAVPGLQRGRGEAREAEEVAPADPAHVEATLPHLPPPVRAMAEVQLLTGMRAGEVMTMRAIDLSTTGPVWVYRPASHKNRLRGKDRVIFLGPKAQEVIRPFLKTDLHAYLFSPRAWMEEQRARRAAARKTKRPPSQLARKRKARPKRAPGERYTRRSYRYAVVRACHKAGVPEWSPLQLRHTAGTLIRQRYGVEAARVVLGHSKVETSQIYAERDLGAAQRIMAEMG